MNKFAMENATFTYKDIIEISNQFSNINERLNAVADKVKATTGISISFCKIIGSRWSFCAGDISLDIPEHRIKISYNYGVITSEICITGNEWRKILDVLKKFVEKETFL